MEEEMITIAKKPGVKNCVRINNENDIPDFLKEVINIDGNNLVNGEYYSFIGCSQDKLFMSKNV